MEQAAVPRQGAVTVPATRGAILDATGYPLATSVDTWNVSIDRLLWRDRQPAPGAADAPAGFLPRDGRRLQQLNLWGVRLTPSSVRLYPEGDLAGPLIGYVGLDSGGLWGVEADL